VDHRIAGLDSGADDYLVKPFVAGRAAGADPRAAEARREPGEVLAHGDVVLDVNGRWARRAGRELELSPREVDLRELLLRNAGRW
jgi:DNA-binding response OmpR family regulator